MIRKTNGNWNGVRVSDAFGGEEVRIGYVDGWLTTSQNMVKILNSTKSKAICVRRFENIFRNSN